MKSMTLYVDKKSLMHDIDPLTKLLYVIVSIAVTYILPIHTFVFAVTAISVLLLIIGKVFRKILPIIAIGIILIVSIIIVQGAFHPDNKTVLFSLGGFAFYQEGLSYALLITLRVINMLSSFGVLILTTKPDELMERLMKKGMSPKIGYVLLSVLQIIPQMQATMGKITDAQRSRGMETEGNLFVRMRAFFPLIGPVVLNSLNDTRERAIALEMRGFNTKQNKTFLHAKKDYRHQGIIQLFLYVVFVGAIVWRICL
ncbi:energy-coupling factor transporter transmembrane protein EcfT [Virgibacillus dakarensis]|uniref:Cobalt ABC transporter permease n=1 Tax=Lentibacillus populi TaxID=1827502 RepID=A0A9W5TYM8_9BACI|nr:MULTISPECIES: energy-coupling factor transporter transmembrane component T [Bacillaceae]MBT2216347.1 energy-coupling factor transporter transmembrane protein EcfT [Virgibacillus dakarensis]MTW85200.1 energy-coupling factor transporter transmembrane protein EcfT [Virgibacillus dakarensis]GGB43526.1 cobalt ABC transporter permease [Lentibacillus populi]